jgi:hypothetical protein
VDVAGAGTEGVEGAVAEGGVLPGAADAVGCDDDGDAPSAADGPPDAGPGEQPDAMAIKAPAAAMLMLRDAMVLDLRMVNREFVGGWVSTYEPTLIGDDNAQDADTGQCRRPGQGTIR